MLCDEKLEINSVWLYLYIQHLLKETYLAYKEAKEIVKHLQSNSLYLLKLLSGFEQKDQDIEELLWD